MAHGCHYSAFSQYRDERHFLPERNVHLHGEEGEHTHTNKQRGGGWVNGRVRVIFKKEDTGNIRTERVMLSEDLRKRQDE